MAQPTIPYLLPQQTLGGTLCTLYGIILCHIIKISSTLQTYLPSEFRNSHGAKKYTKQTLHNKNAPTHLF